MVIVYLFSYWRRKSILILVNAKWCKSFESFLKKGHWSYHFLYKILFTFVGAISLSCVEEPCIHRNSNQVLITSKLSVLVCHCVQYNKCAFISSYIQLKSKALSKSASYTTFCTNITLLVNQT